MRGIYHPNSYLTRIKNVKRGLVTRSALLAVLDEHSADARTIASKAGLHYGVVMHHTKMLEKEGILRRVSSKPIVWEATGTGQKRLNNTD